MPAPDENMVFYLELGPQYNNLSQEEKLELELREKMIFRTAVMALDNQGIRIPLLPYSTKSNPSQEDFYGWHYEDPQ